MTTRCSVPGMDRGINFQEQVDVQILAALLHHTLGNYPSSTTPFPFHFVVSLLKLTMR